MVATRLVAANPLRVAPRVSRRAAAPAGRQIVVTTKAVQVRASPADACKHASQLWVAPLSGPTASQAGHNCRPARALPLTSHPMAVPLTQVADHTEARQYVDTRHHAHVHNHREYEEMYNKRWEGVSGCRSVGGSVGRSFGPPFMVWHMRMAQGRWSPLAPPWVQRWM